jgi:hypothetical protein
MKTSISNLSLFLLFLILPCFSFARGSEEFTKTITKQFDIARDGTVGIMNKYGSIDIRTWNESQVKIEVTLKVEAKNQEMANGFFDRVTITFDNSPAVVRAATELETTTGWKSWFDFGSDSDEFEINYVVHAPSTVALELDNKYGDIYVGDMNNRATINLKYGDMKLGAINGKTTIAMGYSDGTITSTKDLDLDLSYSELYAGQTGNISFNGKYSDLEVEMAGDVSATTGYVDVKIQKMGRLTNVGKYDDFSIDEAASVDVNAKYSGFTVSHLHEYAEFDMSYGSINIDFVYPNFQSITVNTSYTDVSIDVDDKASFHLEAATKYCGIDHYGLEVYHEIDKTGESSVKGYRGSRDASSKIVATMSYGELTIR